MRITNHNVLTKRFIVLAAIVTVAGAGWLLRGGPAQAGAAQPSATPGVYMGELVGRDARVAIIGSGAGVRFDVRSSDGTVVAAGLTADQVAGLLPGQDPRGAMAQEPMKCGPLMMVEPELSRAGIE